MRPTRIREIDMIANVIAKGNYYQTINETGKKIKEIHNSSVGILQGFTDRFVVFLKGNYYVTYDENFRKIKDCHTSTTGIFQNAAGQFMNFIKGNYLVTYDMNFKRISQRYYR